MKNKEINSLVAEKGNLIDSLQKRNQEVETLDDNLKFNKNEILRLNQNIKVLNKKLSELSSLLIQAEKEDERNKVQIKNLGEKLNQALANKVQELKKYQSSFFKKIKESLGDRDDIKISGDRFIFPSEIFFESGSDQLQLNSLDKLKEVAKDLLEISRKIPKSIDWILRIDGHTDKIPINNDKFNSNWHLSTSRAINIVNFFVKQGIPPHRLVAAGFGENYPLNKEDNEESYRKNRMVLKKKHEKSSIITTKLNRSIAEVKDTLKLINAFNKESGFREMKIKKNGKMILSRKKKKKKKGKKILKKKKKAK